MRHPFLLFALTCAVGCSESSVEAPGSKDLDAGAVDAVADAPDFSALDPSLCPASGAEELHGFDASVELASSGSVEQDKAFYVLTLLQAGSLGSDSTLSSLAAARAQALNDASQNCGGDVTCIGTAVKWTDADIETAGTALTSAAGAASTAASLRQSGTAQLHADATDTDLLRLAWADAAHALNQGFDDHFTGLSAADQSAVLDSATKVSAPFFAPLLTLVLESLAAEGRDEATRYEPLAQGENAAALARIPSLDFSKYPFSVVMVPGLGPTNLDAPLSEGGQVRADQAAARFSAGLAPVIVLSGGHVHPDRTPYSEAIEMKKYLMQTYSIPESALLIDPHARHTTTNLRNVARLMYRYGIPTDQPVLITTDFGQTLYIAATSDAAVFGKRCLSELGYKPWRGITRLDDLDNCWIPSVQSLQQDARDLLDP